MPNLSTNLITFALKDNLSDSITSMPLVEGLSVTIGSFMSIVQILVGGLFGMYVLTFLYRLYIDRKELKQIKKISRDMTFVKHKIEEVEKITNYTKRKLNKAIKK